MEKRKVSMSTFIIIIGIIVIGILACYLVVLTQKEANSSAKVEQLEKNIQEIQTQLQQVETERNNLQDKLNSVANVIGKNNAQISEENTNNAENTEDDNDSSENLQKFEFSTPVGEEGIFEIYAEKAVQATGFSGASAHIYYLREGILYYHNQGDKDTKLASGITDLKQQGEDIIALKGNDAKVYVENQYIQYQ